MWFFGSEGHAPLLGSECRPPLQRAGAARARDNADGKAFVSPLDDVVRVRTGEHGECAL